MDFCRLSDNNIILGTDQRDVRPIKGTQWTDGKYEYISVGFLPSERDIELMQQGQPLILDVRGPGFPPVFLRVPEPEQNEESDKSQ